MPIYNAEKTLADAVKSILNQRHKKLELIMVDDASTDNSLEIAKTFLSDPRVSLYHNTKNKGAYYSRNAGLYFGKDRDWDFFTTHDADDISYPHRYETVVKYLKNKVVGVQDVFVRKDFDTGEIIDEALTMAHAVFRRKVFNEIGYFEGVRFGGDWEYWARLREYNKINGLSTASCHSAMGDSYIHGKNLTVVVPIGSQKRLKYIASTQRRLARLSRTRDFYQGFDSPESITKRII